MVSTGWLKPSKTWDTADGSEGGMGEPQEASPTEKEARRQFDREEYKIWGVATPVLVRNLSIARDKERATCCLGDPLDSTSGLQPAPNLATAMLGRWVATKLRLSNPAPHQHADNPSDSKFVVKDVSALFLPGEMTLVLGPSSSGKSTLLRMICDKISGKHCPNLEGTVMLGNQYPSELDDNLARTTAFVDQSDMTLTPILTVEETLKFALASSEGMEDEADEYLEGLLRLVGLDHVKSTVVGNADIRGVSGGQKRRVKVLEMATGQDARVFFLDEITNGLDAASALSLNQVCRAAAETNGISVVTCLLQPSTEVFRTFHRLVLLTQGGQVAYSGRRAGALAHFESLGLRKPDSMNEPEFLLRCTSSPEEFWDGEGGGMPESLLTPDALAQAFKESDAGQELIQDIDQVASEEAKKNSGDNRAELRRLDDFARPMHKQVSLLLGRGWKLVVRNPASWMRIIAAALFGAIVGTLFLSTPSDEKGTITRAGYVLTLLFIGFLNSCMAPLEDLYADRITFYTHRKASFYRTASYYVSVMLCHMPVALIEAFLLAVLSFFAVGMDRHVWGFFYFWGLFSLLTLSGLSVSRVLAYTLPTPDVAQTLGPAMLLFFIMTSLYNPIYSQIPIWLRWISWLSPCAYCYEGVMINETFLRNVGEMPGVAFAQEVLNLPRVPYDQAPVGLTSPGLVMAFDGYLLFALTLVFDILGCIALHKSQEWYGPNTKRYQVSSGMSLQAPPWKAQQKVGALTKSFRRSVSIRGGSDSGVPKAPPAHLTAKNIVYEVDVDVPKTEQGKLSHGLEAGGSVEKSLVDESSEEDHVTLTARDYGQTGKGAAANWVIKRRLGEDAVSSSKASSTTSTEAPFVNDLDPPSPGKLRLLSGITATFEPGTMTALMGSSGAGKSTLLDVLAGYKTGGHISGDININGEPKTHATWRAIAGYCEQTDLHNPAMTVRESLIFSARMRLRPFSLSDNAKVRFAEEVLELLDLGEFADMLVGDEASGQGLPKHARKRLTVGVELSANPSILFADEPTSGLDSLSASVVVSSLERAARRVGLTVVCTIHQPSREVFETFDNLLLLQKGGVCVYNGPVAALNEYMCSAPEGQNYARPPDINPADHALDIFCGDGGTIQDWGSFYKSSRYAAEALSAFDSCSCTSCSKGGISITTDVHGILAELWLVLQRQALAHWRTPTYMAVRMWWTIVANIVVGLVYFDANQENTVGAIFFYVNIATVPLMVAAVPLITERAIFYREVASGTYRRMVYGVAIQLAEIPYNLLAGVISFIIFYSMVGMKEEADKIGYFILMALATYWVLPAFGQLLALVSPNLGAAVGLASLLLTLYQLTMGFLIAPQDIPPWYIWIYWINPLRYILQGFVVNEVGNDNGGGDEILATLAWSYDQKWWYCYVAVILFGTLFSFGVVLASRISWLKR